MGDYYPIIFYVFLYVWINLSRYEYRTRNIERLYGYAKDQFLRVRSYVLKCYLC